MADVTPIATGDIQWGGNNDSALWLKVFGGEVLTQFQTATVISPLLTSRTISSGKSAQFPITGRTSARYFEPGNNILTDEDGEGTPRKYLSGDNSKAEKVITINDLLISSFFVDQLDEMKGHYDFRSIYAKETGQALARHLDRTCMQALVKASTTGSNDLTNANAGTSPSALIDEILAAAQKLDENDVPREGRFIVVDPTRYYLLVRSANDAIAVDTASESSAQGIPQLLDKDFGAFQSGIVARVAGMPVIMSNNTGFGDSTADYDDAGPGGGDKNDLTHDLSGHVAMVAHGSSAGVLKLKDIAMEQEYLINRQGHLIVSKMAVGVNELRTEAAVAIKTA